MQRIVAVDPHAAVEMRRRVDHSLAPFSRPVLRHGNLRRGRKPGREPRRGLQRGQPNRLGVDVRVGRPLTYGLERRDRLVELHSRLRVFRGQLECGRAGPCFQDAERSRCEFRHAPDDFGAVRIFAAEEPVDPDGDAIQLHDCFRTARRSRLSGQRESRRSGVDDEDPGAGARAV